MDRKESDLSAIRHGRSFVAAAPWTRITLLVTAPINLSQDCSCLINMLGGNLKPNTAKGIRKQPIR